MGNMQGSYTFLSLLTRKKVTRRKFTEMPITENVIRKIDTLGKRSKESGVVLSSIVS
jgi:hypothetical protein